MDVGYVKKTRKLKVEICIENVCEIGQLRQGKIFGKLERKRGVKN